MRKVIIVQLATLLCFWLVFLGLQNTTIYNNSLGLVSNNWQYEHGERYLAKKPFDKMTNKNFVQWDAVHYFKIKNHGYIVADEERGDFIFAFFPLFPLIWKLTNLPPIGILFLNYMFFSISIIILLRLFSKPENYLTNTLLSLSLPSIMVFFIPYTEATYLLLISIGIYGFMKNKYWVYFLGLFLAALTRPSFTFLLLSILGAEFFFLLKHRNIKSGILNMIYRTIPLILGTVTVSLIQYSQGSGSFFKFMEVQKYWDNVLTVPHNLRDWSFEGFGINIGVIIFIFIPLMIILFQLFYHQLSDSKKNKKLDYFSPKDYLLILSFLYLIGNSLFILLFRGGSLHCLFRFTICSPFFYILIFIAFYHLRNIPPNIRFFILATLSLISIFILGLADYSTYWNFSDFGIFLFIGTTALWLFQDFKSNKFHKISLFLLLFSNIVWTTYLINTYIINGWVIA